MIIAPTTVLQLISMAGGLKDFADSKNIMIVRVTAADCQLCVRLQEHPQESPRRTSS